MLEVIITVHDQKIILDFEDKQKYRGIEKYTYAFVGNGECDLIRHLPNVVIARELEHNIEHYKNLVDFTAWYAFSVNNLVKSEYVALLQYDTAITSDFYEESLDNIIKHKDAIIGYQEWPILDENFIDNNVGYQPLADALELAYNINLRKLVTDYVAQNSDRSWPSSNNLLMSRSMLSKYVNWFKPMIDSLGPNLYSGHSVERSLKIFSILHNVKNFYLPTLAYHYQLNSHGTQGFEVDFAKEINRVGNNELPQVQAIGLINKLKSLFCK